MYLFGYGSLMNEESLKKTTPEASVVGVAYLKGFRRVFGLKSNLRINQETGVPSSVLNVERDNDLLLGGTLIELPDIDQHNLLYRESLYERQMVTLEDGTEAVLFIAEEYKPHSYVFDDPLQKEYLDLCLEASRKLGIYDNFLDTTFIDGKTVREVLV